MTIIGPPADMVIHPVSPHIDAVFGKMDALGGSIDPEEIILFVMDKKVIPIHIIDAASCIAECLGEFDSRGFEKDPCFGAAVGSDWDRSEGPGDPCLDMSTGIVILAEHIISGASIGE